MVLNTGAHWYNMKHIISFIPSLNDSNLVFILIVGYVCSPEIKRRLLLGRKVMTNLESIFKSRDISLPTKVCLVKAMVFPVVMYGCESWTVKKAEPKNWCFWPVVLEKTLESPMDCKEIQSVHSKGDQSWLSLKGLMLKLKLQYFGHLMWRVDSLEKTDAGRDCGQEEKGTTEDEMAGWHHQLNGHGFE